MSTERHFKIEHGDFQVVRACCESGNCTRCLAAWNKSRRKTVVQIDGLSRKTAEQVAQNWSRFDARIERMPGRR
jgi:hypothetical protein